MSLSLDGSTRYVGTEFIKLLNTGSSNLATEEFVTDAVAGGGGGGDLTNYYDKTETDTLLDTKLNINNPQNMEGALNIGSVGGASKIIINALSSTKDFYCNGDAQVLGNHLVQSLDSTSYIKGTNLISNTINADNLNDIFFQSNGANYLQLDVSENKLVSSKLIQCGGNLTTQEIDTIAPLDLVIKRGGVDYITLADGQVNFNQPTNISVDTSNLVKKTGETDQRVDGTVSVNGDTVTGYELTVNGQVHTQGMFVASNTNLIFGSATRYITNPPTSNHIRHYTNGEHQFYCDGIEDFLIDQDKALARGNMLCVGQFQGNTFNSFNKTSSDVSFKKANLDYIKLGGDLSMVEMPRGVRCDNYNAIGNADATFKRNSVDFFYLRNNAVDLNAGIAIASDGASINEISSKPSTDLTFQRAGTAVMKLNSSNQLEFLGGAGKCLIYEEQYVDVLTFNVLRIRNTEASNNRIISFGVGATLDVLQITDSGISSAVEITATQLLPNNYNSNGINDVSFKRNGVELMKIKSTDVEFAENIVMKQDKKAYFNVETNKDVYINCFTESNVRVLALYNQDPVGQVRIGVDDNTAVIGLSKNNVTVTGDLVSSAGYGVTADEVFTNIYDTRYNTGDVAWQYNNNAYMYFDASENTFKFGVNLVCESTDFSCRDITCNQLTYHSLVSASDRALKENIEDVETDCVDILKKVQVKKFNMKEGKDKKKEIGFIAQEVFESIPDDFENVIGKVNGDFMGLDYTKMGVILWKCCQEQQPKIEHLESRLFEVEILFKII